jgi:hypothetical protein
VNNPPLVNNSLFILAYLKITNAQVIKEPVNGFLTMPEGITSLKDAFLSAIIDDDGKSWGFALGDAGAIGIGSEIIIASLPIQPDGSLCLSVYDAGTVSEVAADFGYAAGKSDAGCGLQ